jgi:hypothetical protein
LRGRQSGKSEDDKVKDAL